MRLDDFVPDRELLDKGERVPTLILGVTRAFTCDGQGAICELASRDICQICAVDAAGEGDDRRSHFTQYGAQFLLFRHYFAAILAALFRHRRIFLFCSHVHYRFTHLSSRYMEELEEINLKD